MNARTGQLPRSGQLHGAEIDVLVSAISANTDTTFSEGFETDGALYLREVTILNPRFVRFNVTVDF